MTCLACNGPLVPGIGGELWCPDSECDGGPSDWQRRAHAHLDAYAVDASEWRPRWHTWHLDRVHRSGVALTVNVTRWRLGWFLTVYRIRFKGGGVQWWFYGPFNICIGAGHG